MENDSLEYPYSKEDDRVRKEDKSVEDEVEKQLKIRKDAHDQYMDELLKRAHEMAFQKDKCQDEEDGS